MLDIYPDRYYYPTMAKKKGPGRPKLSPEQKGRGIELYLKQSTIDTAEAIGGNVSRGVEMAVREYWNSIQPQSAGRPLADRILVRIRKMLAGSPSPEQAMREIRELLADNQPEPRK